MNNDTALLVRTACDDLGLEVRSYSGRGMYGRSCVGVNCDGNAFQTLARILIALAEQGNDGLDAAEHFTRDGAVASDSMGLGSIIYFPRLPWVDVDSEDDEEPNSGDDERAVGRFADFERSPQT